MKIAKRLRTVLALEAALCAVVISWPAAGYISDRAPPPETRTETHDAPVTADRLPSFVLSPTVPSLAGPIAASSETPTDGEILVEGRRVPARMLDTVLKAARSAGVDASYLCALVDKESGWEHGARSRSSSAAGLFQFLEGTWLRMVKSHGAAWGLQDEAAAIALGRSGPRVADAAMKSRILALRHDPWLSSVLAAEMIKRDRVLVGGRIGRDLNATESYLAHFLGPAGASRVLSRGGKGSVAGILPASARANRSLFYAKRGRRMQPLGFAEFYGRLDQMIGARMRRYASFAPPTVAAGF